MSCGKHSYSFVKRVFGLFSYGLLVLGLFSKAKEPAEVGVYVVFEESNENVVQRRRTRKEHSLKGRYELWVQLNPCSREERNHGSDNNRYKRAHNGFKQILHKTSIQHHDKLDAVGSLRGTND